MAKVNIRGGKAVPFPAGILTGNLCAVGITAIFSAVITWCVLKGMINFSTTGYWSMVNLLISTVCGCCIACLLIKSRRMLACLCVGIAYYLSLVLANGLLLGGHYKGLLVVGIIVAVGCVTVGLVLEKGWRRDFRSRKKYKYR